MTRSGRGPEQVDRIRADASDPAALIPHVRGAAALYNGANPPSYRQWDEQWPPLAASLLRTAEETGAVLVTMSNLYGYGPVAGADPPRQPPRRDIAEGAPPGPDVAGRPRGARGGPRAGHRGPRLALRGADDDGGRPARVRAVPRTVSRALGLVVPVLREVDELMYQFDRPFVVDAGTTTETFGLRPTPWTETLAATVAGWSGRAAAPAR